MKHRDSDLYGPWDLDEIETEAAHKEAAEFVKSPGFPWKITADHGTYREKRPGLGVEILYYEVDFRVEPHKMTLWYCICAWRTPPEKRFGDSLLVLPTIR